MALLGRIWIIPSLTLSAGLVHSAPNGAPRFIPITPEIIRASDGSQLTHGLENTGWTWRPNLGNGGILESSTSGPSDILMIQVDGLKSGQAYEIFGYFWADGEGLNQKEKRQQNPAQFGTSLATLHSFDGQEQPTKKDYIGAWEVVPGGTSGRSYGLDVAIEQEQPLIASGTLKLNHGKAKLVRARLGRSRADSDGCLPVFFAKYPYPWLSGSTWIDGVAVRPVDAEGPLEEGWKKGTWLHLALRAGDTVTIERELTAGADLNQFDEENLTPLFYSIYTFDNELIRRLLDLGADPNRAGQSISPLNAAATTGQADVVRMLLEAGADVPLTAGPIRVGLSRNDVHPLYLHPIFNAFNIGSVPIIEMLLAKQPDIDVHELFDAKDIALPEYDVTARRPNCKFLQIAIRLDKWDLACWLVDNGYATLGGYELESTMLPKLVVVGEPAMPLFERLLKAGVPAIGYHDRINRAQYYWLEPFDALTAAVWSGDVALTKRFLKEAPDKMPLLYIRGLRMQAAYTQNSEILELLDKNLPNPGHVRWKPSNGEAESVTLDDAALRIFLPRTKAPLIQTKDKNREYVLGVIASPEADVPASILTLVSSQTKGWQVVDREHMEAAMLENDFDKPWLKGEHNLANLGDRLSADALMVVDVIKADKRSVYSFELVEVATGLVIHREHILNSEFTPDSGCKELLERSARSLKAAATNTRRQAVTLLSFTARGGLPNELALAKTLEAFIQREIDSTSGMISLTRAQSARLVEEQAMQGKNSIWGAAHLVEGSISPGEDEYTIKVSLRLETLGKKGSSEYTDSEASGPVDKYQQVAREAWRQLLTKAGSRLNVSSNGAWNQAAIPQAEEEGKRLLREAEWLMNAGRTTQRVDSLLIAAYALGAPPDAVVRNHLNLLLRRMRVKRNPNFPDTFPITIDESDRLAYNLPIAHELLHYAEFYFTAHGDSILKKRLRANGHSNEFWVAITDLAYMNAAIYRGYISEEDKQSLELLGQKLEAFIKGYYAALDNIERPNLRRSILPPLGSYWIYKLHPELYRGMVRTIPRMDSIRLALPTIHDLERHTVGIKLARDVLKEMENDDSILSSRLQSEINCYLGDAADHPKLSRQFIDAAINNCAADPYYSSYDNSLAITYVIRSSHSAGYWFGWSPMQGSSLLPTLIHNPRPAPDVYRMSNVYLGSLNYRQGLSKPVADRWIGNSEVEYDKAMRGALQNKDADKLSKLLDAVELHQMYSGHNHRPIFESRYRSALNNMLAKENEPAHEGLVLKAGSPVDIRDFTTRNPGITRCSIRDCDDPNVLWVMYCSRPNKELGTIRVDDMQSKKIFGLSHHWLLGVDCSTGKVKTKVNLDQALLDAVGCNLPAAPTDTVFPSEFDQNQNSIMLNTTVFHSRDLSHQCRGHGRIMVIDKATGKARSLPEEYRIAYSTEYDTHAHWEHVVGIGDDFFFIDKSGYDRAVGKRPQDQDKSMVYLWRVRSDLTMSPLAEHGRRPMISPFDDLKSIAHDIAVHDNRLLVYNAKEHHYFNPRDNSWEKITNHHQAFGFKMISFANSEKQRAIDAIHDIRVGGKETGWTIDHKWVTPDSLRLNNNKLGSGIVRVRLPLPEDFLGETVVIMDEYGKSESTNKYTHSYSKHSYDEYVQKQPFHVVVLNQTDDDIILGLQMENSYRWRRPSRRGSCLPFIWKIPKNELLKAARAVQDETIGQ